MKEKEIEEFKKLIKKIKRENIMKQKTNNETIQELENVEIKFQNDFQNSVKNEFEKILSDLEVSHLKPLLG